MGTCIRAAGLTRDFGDLRAVDGVDLVVAQGEIFGLLGHNGAGKTTIVRLLNGVLRPTAGHAAVLGLDPARDGPALRRRTGVLTESPSLDDRLTGRRNLAFSGDVYGVDPAALPSRIDALLEEFGLADRAGDRVKEYSRGMRQRLALARTLLHAPEVLFLDEPTAGLDPVATRQMHERIRVASRERHTTVVLCTHNLVEAQRLCDRVAVLRDGRIVELGEPAVLAARLERHLTVRFEVAPANLERARDVLAPRAALRLRDGHIELLDVHKESIPPLLQSLIDDGVRVYAVVPDVPSLEDVYFALYEDAEAGAV